MNKEFEIDFRHNAVTSLPSVAPAGRTFIRLPFVGIYQSQLDGDVENEAENIKDWYEREDGSGPDAEDLKKFEDGKLIMHIDWMGIFKKYADATAELLGIKEGEYAGCTVPQFFNYDDVYIYWSVTNEYLKKLYDSVNLDMGKNDTFALMLTLTNACPDLFGKDEAKDYDTASNQVYDKLSEDISLDSFVVEYSTKEWEAKMKK